MAPALFSYGGEAAVFEHYAGEEAPKFVGKTEFHFARYLDRHGIRWLYEPHRFALGDEEHPDRAFTPDFYLPDYDFYFELTVMKQELTTRKNKKIRLMHEQYPEIRVRLLYRRDLARIAEREGFELPEVGSPVEIVEQRWEPLEPSLAA